MKEMSRVRKLVTLAVLAGVAFVVMVVGRIPIMPIPPYLKYDPKDVIITIGGFMFGPLAAAVITILVSLAEMVTVSTTAHIGLVMNIVSGCAFACPAALVYYKRRNIKSAFIGLTLGCVSMTAIMLLYNYFLTPVFLMRPRSEIAPMLIPAFLPFNALKAGLNAGIIMLLYKPLTAALRKARLLPAPADVGAGGSKGGLNIGTALVSVFVIATCVLLILVWRGWL